MSKDVYHEILLHVTWHTKESRRLICASMEPHLHELIRAKALEAGGVYVHRVGGTGNHVRLAARIPPTGWPPVQSQSGGEPPHSVAVPRGRNDDPVVMPLGDA